jgi:SAM-dependent methyltransferase
VTNEYSPAWFDIFLSSYPQEVTDKEIAFLTRHLPLPDYRNVLDICCGMGRHAVPLAGMGYHVTGVDRDAAALVVACQQAIGRADFLEADMRDLASLPGTFDAALSLWQSFGYFDEETNVDIMRQMHDKLNPRGRLVLDIYHRGFFEAQGTEAGRTFEKEGLTIVETRQLTGNRLTVTLDYDGESPPDVFDWQLYTPEDIGTLASEVGFRVLTLCTEYDEAQPATSTRPRMQLVLEKQK